MEQKTKSIILKDWVICGVCGAKLCKKVKSSYVHQVEIKCHQCKTLNMVDFDDCKT